MPLQRQIDSEAVGRTAKKKKKEKIHLDEIVPAATQRQKDNFLALIKENCPKSLKHLPEPVDAVFQNVHVIYKYYKLPYHVENTGSRPITEVKQRRARLVLEWVTA